MSNTGNQWSGEELAELKKVFYAQAYELADELQDAALKLEADPGDEKTLKAVKRQIHTLKGDSNSVGLETVGTLCHRLEDVLGSSPGGPQRPGREAVELFLCGVDAIHNLLARSESGKSGDGTEELLEKIARFLGGLRGNDGNRQHPENGSSGLNGGPGLSLTEYQELEVREALGSGLPVYDLEIGFHPQCGEKSVAALMLAERLGRKGRIIRTSPLLDDPELNRSSALKILFASALDADTIRETAGLAGMTTEVTMRVRGVENPEEGQAAVRPTDAKNDMLRVETTRVDKIMDLVGELIIGRSMLEQAARELAAGAPPGEVSARLNAVNAYLERTVSDLQKGVMKMRMVPVYHVFRKFPKIARDLAKEKGKHARLELVGRETELDKRIVDALGEPLAHIVRNLVDHGIETPEERRLAGKPEEGALTLKAYHEASQVVIEAGDDGRGIDSGKLKQKAVEGGFLTQNEADAMSDREAVNLIFLSGLSTAAEVSETSGRGVGMDAVKIAVESLKGSLEIETTRGKGTLFRLRLPLTLAVIKALLFEVGERLYAVPVPVIAEVARIMTDDLVTVEGKKTLLLRDQLISVIELEELFRVRGNGARKKFVLILGTGARKVGLVIDRLLWQQELVIKAIDDCHTQTDFAAGASILGSGKVVLILDAAAVFRKAVLEEKRQRRAAA